MEGDSISRIYEMILHAVFDPEIAGVHAAQLGQIIRQALCDEG